MTIVSIPIECIGFAVFLYVQPKSMIQAHVPGHKLTGE